MSVGSMTKQVWSGKSTGRLNSREIMFVTKGFFRHETQIIDVQMEAFLGSILYNIWKGKSSVRLNNKEYNLHI